MWSHGWRTEMISGGAPDPEHRCYFCIFCIFCVTHARLRRKVCHPCRQAKPSDKGRLNAPRIGINCYRPSRHTRCMERRYCNDFRREKWNGHAHVLLTSTDGRPPTRRSGQEFDETSLTAMHPTSFE